MGVSVKKQKMDENLNVKLAKYFSSTSTPFVRCEDKLFREYLVSFCNDSRPCEMKFPSRKTLRQTTLQMGNDCFADCIKQLDNSFVSLAIDGWTPHEFANKVTNIICIRKGVTYLLWSDTNSGNDSTNEYLYPLVESKITFLIENNIFPIAVITDNASNMISLGTKIYQNDQFGRVVLHISCTAHTLQLIINDILQLEPIKFIFSSLQSLLNAFKSSKKLRILLRKLQEQNNNVMYDNDNNNNISPLQILFYNQTRWWSKVKSIERIIKLKTFIVDIINNSERYKLSVMEVSALYEAKENEFWIKLQSIFTFTKQFRSATDLVEASNASFINLIHAMEGIDKQILEWKISEDFKCEKEEEKKFKKEVQNIISKRDKSYLNSTDHHAFNAAKILTGNLPYNAENNKKTSQWLIGWGTDVIKTYPLKFPDIHNLAREEINNRLTNQLINFIAGDDQFNDKETIKKRCSFTPSENSFYYNENNLQQKVIDWKLFWKNYILNAQELSEIALIILNIGISEASCERSFSLQKLTHSVLRNKLQPSIIEAEMRYKYNKQVLNNDEIDDVEDLSDGDDD